MSRPEELRRRLGELDERLSRACSAVGRDRSEVTLVAVTKFHPVEDVEALRDLGVRAFGESRDQEARDKAARVTDVSWHFVGRLQTNKAASVASYAAVVESCDRPSLVTALSRGAERAGRTLDVLVQASLDGDPDRGGVPLDGLSALADAVADASGLRLRGVMAVAPVDGDPERSFARLAEAADALRRTHPGATTLSAGMTGDLEQAVAAGSTSVRVGTALLGPRPVPLR